MHRKETKAGAVNLIVYGHRKNDQFFKDLVVLSTETGGLYGSLHLTPDEARALGRSLVEAADNADAPAVQVAA